MVCVHVSSAVATHGVCTYVSSAVAMHGVCTCLQCGGHAGDPELLGDTLRRGQPRVTLRGAHCSFPQP